MVFYGGGLAINIGNESVPRDQSGVLLGMRFQDDLGWKSQIYVKGGVLSSLNSRLYLFLTLLLYFVCNIKWLLPHRPSDRSTNIALAMLGNTTLTF